MTCQNTFDGNESVMLSNVRLVLYAVKALCAFAIGYRLVRLSPWLAKAFAFSQADKFVAATLMGTMLLLRVFASELPSGTSDVLWTVIALLGAIAEAGLLAALHIKNGDVGHVS